jgi:hypothetical protein
MEGRRECRGAFAYAPWFWENLGGVWVVLERQGAYMHERARVGARSETSRRRSSAAVRGNVGQGASKKEDAEAYVGVCIVGWKVCRTRRDQGKPAKYTSRADYGGLAAAAAEAEAEAARQAGR